MRLDLEAFRYLVRKKFWADLWQEINRDDCWNMAARLSYYFLLAFFPFLIFLSALIGFLPLDPGLLSKILVEMNQFLPDQTYTWMRQVALELAFSDHTGLLSLGIILVLLWASVGFSGIIGVLNRAYATPETRSFLTVRLLAMGVTVLLSFFIITSGILLFFGDWLITLLLSRITIRPYPSFRLQLELIYSGSRWFLTFLLLNLGIQVVYCLLPARRLRWTLLSPGSVVATLTWILASQLFVLYVNRVVSFETYQKLYGSLGALILLMIWFYISSLSLLVGGEINSEIFRLRRLEAGEPVQPPED